MNHDEMAEVLKAATAHKKDKDLPSAITVLRQAIAQAESHDVARPAYEKLIKYQIAAKLLRGALADGEAYLASALRRATTMDAFLRGTMLRAAYSIRAEVLLALKRDKDSFLDSARAEWHWRDAMRRQDRLAEFPLRDVADGLAELAAEMELVTDERALAQALVSALDAPSVEALETAITQRLS